MVISAGDFNTNFADKKSEQLSTFLSENMNLKMNHDTQQNMVPKLTQCFPDI